MALAFADRPRGVCARARSRVGCVRCDACVRKIPQCLLTAGHHSSALARASSASSRPTHKTRGVPFCMICVCVCMCMYARDVGACHMSIRPDRTHRAKPARHVPDTPRASSAVHFDALRARARSGGGRPAGGQVVGAVEAVRGAGMSGSAKLHLGSYD